MLLALGAELVAIGPGGARTIQAGHFFTGMMSTALHPDEILTTILVPRAAVGQASAYVKFAHPASRYAVVGAAASITGQSGVCTAVSVVVGGLVPFPRRASGVEQSLTGQQPTEAAVFVTRALLAATARAGLS